MPELPEVEIVCEGLRSTIVGAKIVEAIHGSKKLRVPFPKKLTSIKNCKIKTVNRRAKYILINLDNDKTLIVHLGMSGRFTIVDSYEQKKHDHFLIKLSNEKTAVFNDARRFGLIDLIDTEKLKDYFSRLGVEPLEKSFNAEYLQNIFSKRTVPIKQAIMDQKIVVGVGNIYACEALFDCSISPLRPANALNNNEIERLVKSIKKILMKGLKFGGSSFRDYEHADGSKGSFQNLCKVYGREGEQCQGCICKSGVKRIVQGGRSTFYCSQKQK